MTVAGPVEGGRVNKRDGFLPFIQWRSLSPRTPISWCRPSWWRPPYSWISPSRQQATATLAAWELSAVGVGPLSDTLGCRPVALAGPVLPWGPVVAPAIAPNIEVLLLLRVLAGPGGETLPANRQGRSPMSSPPRAGTGGWRPARHKPAVHWGKGSGGGASRGVDRLEIHFRIRLRATGNGPDRQLVLGSSGLRPASPRPGDRFQVCVANFHGLLSGRSPGERIPPHGALVGNWLPCGFPDSHPRRSAGL